MASCYPAFPGPCPYCDDESGYDEFVCSACEDQGLIEGPYGFAIPCTECSQPIELEDIEDFRGDDNAR